MRLGVIADDFTGATDVGALLARGGADVRLHMGVPIGSQPAEKGSHAQIVALKCRTIAPDAAIDQVLTSLRWLQGWGATHIYWKYCSTFDSTPEGNIGPVADALLDRLYGAGNGLSLHCPAFPENGRTVYKSHLFVGDQLLSDSPMKDHPLTPMRDSNLVRVLSAQTERPVGHVEWQSVQKGPADVSDQSNGFGHIIADAICDADLSILGSVARAHKLSCGGSAFCAHLFEAPDLVIASGQGKPEPGPTLILSGSCSAATRAQVEAAKASDIACHQLDAGDLERSGAQPAIDWMLAKLASCKPGEAVLLASTTSPEELERIQQQIGRDKAAILVEEAMADLAKSARDAGVSHFIVAGGETSGAVTQALKVVDVQIGSEIAPGVPWIYGQDGSGSLALTLKSGNFGARSFFFDALSQVHGRKN